MATTILYPNSDDSGPGIGGWTAIPVVPFDLKWPYLGGNDGDWAESGGIGSYLEVGLPNTVITPGPINWVTLHARASGDGSGTVPDEIQVFQIVGGVSSPADTFTVGLGGISDFLGADRTTNPSGGPWTQADIDAMEIGLYFSAGDGTPLARVYELWAIVTHGIAAAWSAQYVGII